MTISHPNFDLSQLSYVHQQLCNQIDLLYASLNVGQSFPELASLDVAFVQTLLLARDLKMNIRKRAIGTFFEWDRLDQATGGREQALGKFHLCIRSSSDLPQERSFTNKHENQSVAASQLSLQLFGSSMGMLESWSNL